MPNEVRIKKVKAYPIPANLKTEAGVLVKGQVLKLTMVGALIEVEERSIKAGEKLEIAFETPVLHQGVHEYCVVVKLHNQLTTAPKYSVEREKKDTPTLPPAQAMDTRYGNVQRIVEIHFKPLSDLGKERINKFLTQLSRVAGTPR